MMILGKGVCSDEMVDIGQAYLARIDNDYFVVYPALNFSVKRVPFREAMYERFGSYYPFTQLHELAPIRSNDETDRKESV